MEYESIFLICAEVILYSHVPQGMEDSLRPEVWKYLLNYYPFESTFKEREIIRQQRAVEYQIYQSQEVSKHLVNHYFLYL